MSYELIDDFDRQADARPDIPTKGGSTRSADLSIQPLPKRSSWNAKPQPEAMNRPVYLCPELGRTCRRPGAYDAYDLPSLYNGELKPYRFSDDPAN